MYPAVIGFYGKSGAGKTSLILKLIKRLMDSGYNVATIKNTDKEIGIDKEGKDTWKHAQAGAKLVVLSSPIETDFLVKGKQDTKEIIEHIISLGTFDIILVEGASDPEIPKIRVGDIRERENTIYHYRDNFEEVFDQIKKEIDRDVAHSKKISVKVNGKNIPLSPFPSSFIINTIVGMLQSLKDIEEINDVDIHFKC